MITAFLFFVVLTLFYVFIPASKIYVLIILGLIVFRVSFEPISRTISQFLTRNANDIYKPLYQNSGSSDFEVVPLVRNFSIKTILFDTKNHNTFVYAGNDTIYKINARGHVIDSVPALSWAPFSNHKLPFLLSLDNSVAEYRDWINTENKDFKKFTELNSDRKMSRSQWDKTFSNYYQSAPTVDYVEVNDNAAVIFKIDKEWVLLNSYANKSDDEDFRFTRTMDGIIFEGFPAKSDSQLVWLDKISSNPSAKEDTEKNSDSLKLTKYKKESFEWPSCPPGLPLPIAGGFTWSGTGYFNFLHQGQLIRFSLPTEYGYWSGYDEKINRYYLPENLALNSDIAFIEISESYSQGFEEDVIHRDGFGLYVIRKRESKEGAPH